MNSCRPVLVIAIVAGLAAHAHAQMVDAAQTFTLDQALQYATDHYPAIRAALEQVNASAAHVTVAKAAYLPRFDALWQSNRATANNIFGQLLPQSVIPSISGPVLSSTSMQAVWGSVAGGLFSWEPVDLGLRRAVVGEAEAGVARAQAAQALTRLEVQQAVGHAFLNVVTAQQELIAAESDVQRRDVLARAARTLADNQLRPGAEASRAEAELAAARTRAIRAGQVLTVSRATLAQMLGIADRPVDVSAAPLTDVIAEHASESASAPTHPLVQSRQADIDLARTRNEVLAHSGRPRLFLQSSLFARGSGANPDGLLENGAAGLGFERANWAIGAQVVFPNLFEFASLRARRAAAGAVIRAETARYDEALLTVTTQQRTAAAVVDAARAIARNTPVQLAAARQSEAQARARYDAGLASIVEVAEAQNLLASAEIQNAAARVEIWRALLVQAAASGDVASLIGMLRATGVQ